MGSECKNICDNVSNAREVFVPTQKDESKPNCHLEINLKTEGAVSEEYFSRASVQLIAKVAENSVIHCEDNIYIIKFESGVTYHGGIVNNERSGFGTQTWPDKAIYVGEWRNN